MMGRLLRMVAAASLLVGAVACAGGEEPAELVPEIFYVDQIEGLRGMDAVHLHTGFLDVGGRLVIAGDLRAQVEERLVGAGLRLIDDEEFQTTPGLPELQIYPSIDGSSSVKDAEEEQLACCRSRVWVSAITGASLDRDPEIHRLLPVWGGGSDRLCGGDIIDVSDLVLGVVDRFAADVIRANSEDGEANPDPSFASN